MTSIPQEKLDTARPPDSPAAALPLEAHEGLAPVAVGALAAARLVSDPLPRTIARVAVPAVASTLLMTIFGTVDAFWVGTKIGAVGIAAVAISIFWIWLVISIAEMVSVGLTAVAARRYGQGKSDEAARAAGTALVFAIVVGTLVAGAGHAILPRLFCRHAHTARCHGARRPLPGHLPAWHAAHLRLLRWWIISLTAIGRGLAMITLWRAGGWKHKSV